MAEEVTINDWTGTGYIVIDPATGADAYMLSGVMAGGAGTVIMAVLLAVAIVAASFALAIFIVEVLPVMLVVVGEAITVYSSEALVLGIVAKGGLTAVGTSDLGIILLLVLLGLYGNGLLTFPIPGEVDVPKIREEVEEKAEATSTVTVIENGQKVFRVYDDIKARYNERSWTPIYPVNLAITAFRYYAGLPGKWNDATFLAIGSVRDMTGIIVRPALPYEDEFAKFPGRMVEYYVQPSRAVEEVINIWIIHIPLHWRLY